MVTRVYGKCDGLDILFSRNHETGRWDATVPFDNDGEYIVEVRAVDEAGNESYYATLLFIIDTANICVKIKVLDISAKVKADGENVYSRKTRMNKWEAEVVRCELCGRF